MVLSRSQASRGSAAQHSPKTVGAAPKVDEGLNRPPLTHHVNRSTGRTEDAYGILPDIDGAAGEA